MEENYPIHRGADQAGGTEISRKAAKTQAV